MVFWNFDKKKVQFNLNKSESNQLLSNIIRSPEVKLRVLKLNDKKLYYSYSTYQNWLKVYTFSSKNRREALNCM